MALISKHKGELEDNIIAPYIDFELMDKLQHKELFYQLCDQYGIEHPGTFVHKMCIRDRASMWPSWASPGRGKQRY